MLYRYCRYAVDTVYAVYTDDTVYTDNTDDTVYTCKAYLVYSTVYIYSLFTHTATLSVHSIQLLYTVTNYSKNDQY